MARFLEILFMNSSVVSRWKSAEGTIASEVDKVLFRVLTIRSD